MASGTLFIERAHTEATPTPLPRLRGRWSAGALRSRRDTGGGGAAYEKTTRKQNNDVQLVVPSHTLLPVMMLKTKSHYEF
jgi:hypothetical protein